MTSSKKLNSLDLKFHPDDFKQRNKTATSFSSLQTTNLGFDGLNRNNKNVIGGFGSSNIISKEEVRRRPEIPFSSLWGQSSNEMKDSNEITDTKETEEIMDANDPMAFWNAWSKQTCKQHFYQRRDGSVIKVPRCQCFEGIGSVL